MSEFEKELGWDDVIEKESDFTLLPAGDYDFTITGFERAKRKTSPLQQGCSIYSYRRSGRLNHNST